MVWLNDEGLHVVAVPLLKVYRLRWGKHHVNNGCWRRWSGEVGLSTPGWGGEVDRAHQNWGGGVSGKGLN